MKATIDFAKYAPSDIVALYVDWSEKSCKTLSVGDYAERKPSVGRVFDATSYDEIASFLDTKPHIKEKYFIVNSPICTAVPSAFFKEARMSDYLYVNQGLTPEDGIVSYTDFWEDEDVFWLYGTPSYVLELIQRQRNTKCYHIVTAILYVLKKQSFFQRPSLIVSYIDINGKLWLISLSKENKLYSVNVYDIATDSDVTYYILRLFNKLRNSFFTEENIQLVLLGAQEEEVQSVYQFFCSHHPSCLITTFSLHNIAQHYRINSDSLYTEDLFLLLLLSLCES